MKGTALAADPNDDRHRSTDLSGVPVTTISVDIPVDDHEWLKKYATYLNELVKAEFELKGGKPGKGEAAHSRKSVVQEGVLAFVAAKRAQIRTVTEKLGELPDAADKLAMKRYAKKAVALSKKQS